MSTIKVAMKFRFETFYHGYNLTPAAPPTPSPQYKRIRLVQCQMAAKNFYPASFLVQQVVKRRLPSVKCTIEFLKI